MDNEEQPATTSPDPEIGPKIPPRPETYSFPAQLLEQWVELPENTRVNATLTRQDIDNLAVGLLRSNDAQRALEATLIFWSQNKNDEANKALVEFQRLNVESVNAIRQFFTGLMIAHLRPKRDE